jgi:hypothetical protein
MGPRWGAKPVPHFTIVREDGEQKFAALGRDLRGGKVLLQWGNRIVPQMMHRALGRIQPRRRGMRAAESIEHRPGSTC